MPCRPDTLDENCRISLCGDGIIEVPESGDDGNLDDGDGCYAHCQTSFLYECQGEPSVCVPICGDSIKVAGEECDDGNLITSMVALVCQIETELGCQGPADCDVNATCTDRSANGRVPTVFVMMALLATD